MILPQFGHVIFTGRPSNYQGFIAKWFADQAARRQSPVEFLDLSTEGLPLDATHERLADARNMLAAEPHTLVISAGHYGVFGPFDVSDFHDVARVWECKQQGQSLDVTLTELWPATGREVHLQGVKNRDMTISWNEVAAPEPAPIPRQRTGTRDNGSGGLIDPNARTQIGEYLKANPTRKVIQ
jgi:hypothetical protein